MVNKPCLWWVNYIILNKDTALQSTGHEGLAVHLIPEFIQRLHWLIYVLLNVRCTVPWFRRKQCRYCLFPFMSAQLWQRLSISHHRNVPGSTFHLTTFATCFKLPKTRYRQLNSIVLYVSVFTVSLMDQHTILLSWFSCAPCMYYHWFRIESASPLPLIWSTYSLLWWY